MLAMRVLTLCAWLMLVSPLAAQTTDTLAFEVISVKRNVSGEQASSSMVQPGGRYNATNMTLRMLVKTAYGVHDDQIAGGPGWANEDRYDVVGKAAADQPTNVFRGSREAGTWRHEPWTLVSDDPAGHIHGSSAG